MTLNDNNSACSSACSSDASTQTDVVPTGDVSLQTELSVRSIGELEEGYLWLSRGRFIKEPKELTEENLQMDDTKVKFYTSLPSFCILKIIFEFISPYIKEHHRSSLSNFQQFLMVLMKLRLNLYDQDLAYRFGVVQSTVSKIMKKWVNVMHVRLKPLVQWPQREQLRRTMPEDFKRGFETCICVIDCFEVFCERPRDLMARAQTYSHYKHHNTVKFLIGITPLRVIAFISKG